MVSSKFDQPDLYPFNAAGPLISWNYVRKKSWGVSLTLYSYIWSTQYLLTLRIDTGDWSVNGRACFMYLIIRCCLKKIYEVYTIIEQIMLMTPISREACLKILIYFLVFVLFCVEEVI